MDEAGLAACGMGLGVGGGLVWLECWIVSLLPFGLTTPGDTSGWTRRCSGGACPDIRVVEAGSLGVEACTYRPRRSS